ncbi:MAG TPA: hypothetical protein VFB23_11380 [Candidatus Acidoferrales bacterium]|nr:hypothetical protein [Candidatus Acidoferrales bacterium]
MPKKTVDLVEKARQCLRARELGSKHYKRADRLLDEIRKELDPGGEIPLAGGKKAVLKDNFQNTNKVFRSHGISRFELEVVEA